jgi:hypothetical protein
MGPRAFPGVIWAGFLFVGVANALRFRARLTLVGFSGALGGLSGGIPNALRRPSGWQYALEARTDYKWAS